MPFWSRTSLALNPVLGLLALAGCSGASGSGPGGGSSANGSSSIGTSASDASCEVRLDGAAPTLPPAKQFSPPRSSIELTTRVAEPELLKLLERELPVELAREK